MADFGRIQVATGASASLLLGLCPAAIASCCCLAGKICWTARSCATIFQSLLERDITLLLSGLQSGVPQALLVLCPDPHLLRYLQKELKEIERDKASGVNIQVKSGSNLMALTGFVEGTDFPAGMMPLMEPPQIAATSI